MTAHAQAATDMQGRAPAGHSGGDHLMPMRVYLGVYVALLVLTLTTVGVSLANLGPASIYVAMAVAIIKASLVAAYFMHLKFDSRINLLVFVSALLFLALFFALTLTDLRTRDAVVEDEGTFVERDEQAAASAAKPAQSAPVPAPAHSGAP